MIDEQRENIKPNISNKLSCLAYHNLIRKLITIIAIKIYVLVVSP